MESSFKIVGKLRYSLSISHIKEEPEEALDNKHANVNQIKLNMIEYDSVGGASGDQTIVIESFDSEGPKGVSVSSLLRRDKSLTKMNVDKDCISSS